GGGGAGEGEHQPVLGDALHPGADVGDDLAEEEQPVVPDPQRGEHGGLAGGAVEGCRGVVGVWCGGGSCSGSRTQRVHLLVATAGATALSARASPRRRSAGGAAAA